MIKEGGGYISIARRWFVFTSMLHQPPEQRIPKHSRRQARTMAAWLYATRPASDKRPNGSETSKHRPELSRRSGRVGIRCSHLSADRNAVLCVELELLLADLEEAHLGGGRTQGHGGGEGGLCRRCASQQSTGHAEDVGGASVGAENSFSSEALLEAQSMWGESGRQRRYMPADSSPARACPRRAWRLRCEHSQRTVESYSTRYTRESRKTLPYPSYTVIDQPFFFQVALLCAVLSPPPRHGARGHLLRDDLRLADHHGLQHPPQTALLLSCATHTHAPPLSCCPAASASAALCCSAALATRLRGVLCLPCVLLLHRALGGGARRRRRRNALQRPRQVRRTCYLSSLEPLHTARV